jgi:hydrogenase maturation protease
VRDALPAAGDRPRLIGLGNAWRGDDAAGLVVARRLGGVAHEGDAVALLEEWAGAAHAVVVDAAVSGAPPGTVHRFDAARPLPAATLRSSSTHAFGLADAVELARALGRLPARLDVYAIEGAGFALGAPLSPPVGAAVERLVSVLGRSAASPFPG